MLRTMAAEALPLQEEAQQTDRVPTVLTQPRRFSRRSADLEMTSSEKDVHPTIASSMELGCLKGQFAIIRVLRR